MTSTSGRRVVVPLTNKSGGGVIAGDVVIVDTANNEAFTTTTTGAYTGSVGVAQETIANNATGRVATSGYVALVNVNASVTRGNYGTTHTVAKQATDGGASRVTGAFCQFLTGGTTPTAQLFGLVDVTGASGAVATDAIWDAKGDLAGGTGANTASKLTVGSNGAALVADSAQTTGLAWALLGAARAKISGADYTITGAGTTTFANVDGTNLSLTITTGARPVLIGLVASGFANNTAGAVKLDVTVDGTAQGGATNGLVAEQQQVASKFLNLSFTYKTAALSAGSHTFNLQWCQANTGHTATLKATDPVLTFWVQEVLA